MRCLYFLYFKNAMLLFNACILVSATKAVSIFDNSIIFFVFQLYILRWEFLIYSTHPIINFLCFIYIFIMFSLSVCISHHLLIFAYSYFSIQRLYIPYLDLLQFVPLFVTASSSTAHPLLYSSLPVISIVLFLYSTQSTLPPYSILLYPSSLSFFSYTLTSQHYPLLCPPLLHPLPLVFSLPVHIKGCCYQRLVRRITVLGSTSERMTLLVITIERLTVLVLTSECMIVLASAWLCSWAHDCAREHEWAHNSHTIWIKQANWGYYNSAYNTLSWICILEVTRISLVHNDVLYIGASYSISITTIHFHACRVLTICVLIMQRSRSND